MVAVSPGATATSRVSRATSSSASTWPPGWPRGAALASRASAAAPGAALGQAGLGLGQGGEHVDGQDVLLGLVGRAVDADGHEVPAGPAAVRVPAGATGTWTDAAALSEKSCPEGSTSQPGGANISTCPDWVERARSPRRPGR